MGKIREALYHLTSALNLEADPLPAMQIASGAFVDFSYWDRAAKPISDRSRAAKSLTRTALLRIR